MIRSGEMKCNVPRAAAGGGLHALADRLRITLKAKFDVARRRVSTSRGLSRSRNRRRRLPRTPLRAAAAEEKVDLAVRRIERVLEEHPNHVGTGHLQPGRSKLAHAVLHTMNKPFR